METGRDRQMDRQMGRQIGRQDGGEGKMRGHIITCFWLGTATVTGRWSQWVQFCSIFLGLTCGDAQ